MSRAAAQVATGLRNPLDRQTTQPIPSVEDELKRNMAVASAPARAPQPEGQATFTSLNRQYRLQLKALPDRMDPTTGGIFKGHTLTALFANGEFKTSDPEVIELMRKSKAFNVDFWDVSELETKSRVAAENSIVNTLRSDPKLLDRVLDRVTREEADAMPSPGAQAAISNNLPTKE